MSKGRAERDRVSEKIVVLGSDFFCTAFKLAGISDTVRATEESIAKDVGELLEKEGVALIITEESLFSTIPNRLVKAIERRAKPIFVPISLDGKKRAENLEVLVKRVLGVDIK
ncbi:MAG: hypothetical protein D6769_02700 [Methanobacteriota archaeon]|nr:MAG: hypothetical protein D6769_02700 [Euryarchaeota archaeon]